ncbi:MAG: DUF2313 domain-containing protein [Clostridiaceae bacterium]|nr:DUF2313 domain-containing protein [Clostridiaceae bacterium]
MSDITQYVPPFLLQIREFKTLYNIENEDLTTVENAIEDVLNQCFLDTATWGLDLWDEFLGINTKEYSIEERRNILKNKLWMRPPFTVARLYDMLRNTADNVYITEDYANYTFEVTLLMKDRLKVALSKIMAQIEEAKPAHLDYRIVLGFLFELQGTVAFKRWFSDILKPCGTINPAGEEVVTTLGRRYVTSIDDAGQSWLSETFLVASLSTYPTAVDGLMYQATIGESKASYFSIDLPRASNTTYCGEGVYA